MNKLIVVSFRCALLVVCGLASLANASSTPGEITCPERFSCVAECGSGTRSCKVKISQAGGIATAIALAANGNPIGNPNDDICIRGGTTVNFVPDPSFTDSTGAALFGTANPFANHVAVPVTFIVATSSGFPAHSSGDRTVHLPPHAVRCFTYNLHHCDLGAPGPCARKDPHVVVSGDGFRPPSPQKDKDHGR